MIRRQPPLTASSTPGNDAFQPPNGAPTWVTATLIENTIRVWQPYYAAPLTADDALAIIQSASQLVELLSRKTMQ